MWRLWTILALLAIEQAAVGQNCGAIQPSEGQYLHFNASANLRTEHLQIPVVFHIVLEDDHAGISDLRVKSQIDALNRDFNLRSTDLLKIPEEFRSEISSANIEFCLSTVDPNGKQTSGITRTTTDIEHIGQHIYQDGRQSVHYDVLGGKDAWDTERYLNIWVAEMESFSGRSSFPGIGVAAEDGIVIDPEYFGNFGVSDPNHADGRTLVHEVGHYLNLRHPWLDDGCGFDDGLEDTPNQKSPYFGCPDPKNSTSCGTLDMVQNFMQYGNDPCLFYFTKDQVAMMRTVLMTERIGLISEDEICQNNTSSETTQLFYNPIKKEIHFTGAEPDKKYTFRIIDISGKSHEILQFRPYYVPSIELSHYPNGIYIIQVQGSDQVFTKKIFKYE